MTKEGLALFRSNPSLALCYPKFRPLRNINSSEGRSYVRGCTTLTITFCPVSGNALFDRLPSFYNLQAMPEMQELPKALDASSAAIFIPNFLVFGDEIMKTVYVSKIRA